MFISQRLYLTTEKEITQKLEIPIKNKAGLFEIQCKPLHLYLLFLSFARITNQEAVDSQISTLDYMLSVYSDLFKFAKV